MVRYTKGKYKFQRKDTYSVSSLSKVILAYLEQLHKQLSEATSCGVPIRYCELQAAVEGKEGSWEADIDLDAAHQIRLKELEELIYIFNDKNEPDIEDYDFTIEMVYEEGTVGEEDGLCLRRAHFDIQGEDEHNRYNLDVNNWELRKQKGYELFGKLYNNLDW